MALPSRPLAAACFLLVLVAGCGTDEQTDAPASTKGSAATESAAPTTPTTSAAPAYRLLSDEELTGALLDVQDLPAGYSPEPPSEKPQRTFCDYTTPFDEKNHARQDFAKGGGLSSELLTVGLRQYASPDEANAAFDALTHTLTACTEETVDGTKLTYAPMSAPKVGDASVGVKINAALVGKSGTDLLQFFSLVGPTLVNTGGGGLVNANAEEVISVLEAQVAAYQTASAQ